MLPIHVLFKTKGEVQKCGSCLRGILKKEPIVKLGYQPPLGRRPLSKFQNFAEKVYGAVTGGLF